MIEDENRGMQEAMNSLKVNKRQLEERGRSICSSVVEELMHVKELYDQLAVRFREWLGGFLKSKERFTREESILHHL